MKFFIATSSGKCFIKIKKGKRNLINEISSWRIHTNKRQRLSIKQMKYFLMELSMLSYQPVPPTQCVLSKYLGAHDLDIYSQKGYRTSRKLIHLIYLSGVLRCAVETAERWEDLVTLTRPHQTSPVNVRLGGLHQPPPTIQITNINNISCLFHDFQKIYFRNLK